MNKLEFLSASLPYGLKCQCMGLHYDDFAETVIPMNVEIIGLNAHYVEINETGRTVTEQYVYSEIFPIIRPLDSLVKECVQADYNNGKPFIPIDELRLTTDCEHDMDFLDLWEEREYGVLMIPNMPFKFAQLFLKWHFWPNMPEGEEVIWVMDEFNPYK